MEKLALLVSYEAKADMREAFLAEIVQSGLLDAIRREEGCLRYEYFRPVEGDGLVLIEEWASEEHQSRHMLCPNMTGLRELKSRFITGTGIERIVR